MASDGSGYWAAGYWAAGWWEPGYWAEGFTPGPVVVQTPLPYSVTEALSPLTAIMAGIWAALVASPVLSSKLGGSQHIVRRGREGAVRVPSVTYWLGSGTGEYTAQGPSAPVLTDRLLSIDSWAKTLDDAHAIAHEVRRVLHQTPVTVPGNVARVAYIGYLADRDEPPTVEGAPARVTVDFRLKAYLDI